MDLELAVNDLDTCFSWEMALLLVSLERVVPLWEALGLRFAASGRVLELIRSFVREQQQLAASPDDSYPARLKSMLRRLLDAIAACEGEAGAERLRHWVEHSFIVHRRSPRWLGVWRSLLTRIDASQEPVLVRLTMPPEKARLLVELSEQWARRSDTVDEIVARAESLPLAGWDEQQYRLYRRESPLVSPLDYLSSHLRAVHFAAVWAQISETLSARELDVLNTWGQITTATQTTITSASAEIPISERGRT